MADLPLGIFGRPACAWVSDRGVISFADGSPDLAWHVAADDRWHDPTSEATVRRSDRSGLPIVSTRMRIPGGDVVHTAWCVAGPNGPIVVVELENDSPMPIAVALTRTDISVPRPVATRGETPGLHLDGEATVLPIGHRARVRIAVGRDQMVDRLASPDEVAAGWSKVLDGVSRIVLPDRVGGEATTDRVTRAKVEIALGEPHTPPRDADALSLWLLDAAHASRIGAWTTERLDVASAIERIVRRSRRGRLDPLRASAVRAGAIWLSVDDPRTIDDVERVVSRAVGSGTALGSSRVVDDGSLRGGALISAIEETLVQWRGADDVVLCPAEQPVERFGSSFEAHGIPLPCGALASMAVRWHGANAAALWEIVGGGNFRLHSGLDATWTSVESRGDGLWRVERDTNLVDEPGSFA